jgi:uncharacterized protein (DUF1501 family)
VLKLTPTHGLHPSLAPLVPSWESKELAIVQGLGYPGCTQQHYRDIDSAFTACDGTEYSADGWVTRALANGPHPDADTPDAMAFDMLDIRLADPMGPFRGNKLAALQVYRAGELLRTRELKASLHEATARGQEIADHARKLPPVALRTSFPDDPFGDAVRASVEMAALDRSLPVIHITLNGLDDDKHHSVDCHWEQLKYHGDALKRLAAGLVALREGLKEIGRWDDTLVVTYDEFGRSPMENEDKGTHHGLATTHFAMGGRVRGGLHGEAPPVVRVFNVGGPQPTIDTRRLWTTVVEKWWQRPAEGVFSRRYGSLDLIRG